MAPAQTANELSGSDSLASSLLATWMELSLSLRIGLIGLIVLIVSLSVFVLLRRIGQRGRRQVLSAMTALSLLGTLVLGAWAMRLPNHEGSYFELWHQIVRVSAAVSATLFVIGALALSLPWVLDRIEGGTAVGYVAARHVRASKSGFLTVISILSITGVALSSLALCVVISIMGGFGADLKRKILGNNAHITVSYEGVGGFGDWDRAVDDVRLVPGVVAATPVAAGEAMASSNSNTAGVIVRGIEPESVGTVIDLVDNIEAGSIDFLENPDELLELPEGYVLGHGPGGQRYLKERELSTRLKDVDPDVARVIRHDATRPALIIGRELAKSLHVMVGDEVRLVAPLGDLGPMGVMPRTRRFRVGAIFYSGMYEYDSSHAYMLLSEAQAFLDLEGKINHVEVKVENSEQVEGVRQAVATSLDGRGLAVKDWKELNRNLFSALKLERLATFIILCIAITVACFCIVCTLLLMVTEKSKEIAIIKALGASDTMVLRIFMTEGLIIGSIGTVFGVVTGWVLCEGLRRLGVRLDPEVYYVDQLPIQVDVADYALIAVCALAITVLATVYPALAASRVRPVDGIRYE